MTLKCKNNTDRFKLKKNSNTGSIDLVFFDGQNWQPLTKQSTYEILAVNWLKCTFGGINVMRNVFRLSETEAAIEFPFKAVNKLRLELPTDTEMKSMPIMELSSLAEDIHVQTQEAS